MVVHEVLVEIANSLSRTEIEALCLLDRSHGPVIGSSFDGKGPRRYALRADVEKLSCSSFGEEKTAVDADEFCRYLKNCYIHELTLVADAFSGSAKHELRAISGSYSVKNLRISQCEESLALELLSDVPQCTTLSWEGCPTSEFFDHPTIRSCMYLAPGNLISCDVSAVVDWLNQRYESVQTDIPRGMNVDVWEEDSKFEPHALRLVEVLKKQFLDDDKSREYDLVISSEFLTTGTNKTFVNQAGDVLEVEYLRTCYCEVRLTRLSSENAIRQGRSRKSIVTSKEGPKVWDFSCVHALDKYLIGRSITELMARSGVIANEMRCKCGAVMHIRQHRFFGTRPSVWRCTGTCTNLYGQRFTANVLAGSWFADVSRLGVGPMNAVKLVILHATEQDYEDYARKTMGLQSHQIKAFKGAASSVSSSPSDDRNFIKDFWNALRRSRPFDVPFTLPTAYTDW